MALLVCSAAAAGAQPGKPPLLRAEDLIEDHLRIGRRGVVSPLDWRRAARAFDDQAREKPRQLRWRARAAYCEANALLEERRFAESEPLLEECRTLDARWAPCLLCLGIARGEMGRLDSARAALLEGLRLKPRLAYLHRALGVVERNAGRMQEAESRFKRAAEFASEMAAAWSNLGDLYTLTGRLREAEKPLRRGVRLDPAYASGHGFLAYFLLRSERLEEAEAELKKARILDPRDPSTHHNLGLLYRRQRRFAEAIESFDRALGLATDAREREALEKMIEECRKEGVRH